MNTRRCCPGRYGCLFVIAIFMAACASDEPDDDTIAIAPGSLPRPFSVRIQGPTRVTLPGQSQFTAVQTWTDGTPRDVTKAATWTSSNPAVLLVNAGLGMALAAGEVGLTARVGELTSGRLTVAVIPTTAEWNGTYTLTVGGGACSGSLAPALRQRTFTANVVQRELTLTVGVSTYGNVTGRIENPTVRFTLTNYSLAVGRVQPRRVAARLDGGTSGLSLRQSGYPRLAYWGPPDTSISEPLPDGNRLVIIGEAVTTMSVSGFTGTLNGALILYEGKTWNQLAVCSSPSHAFILARS